MLKTILVLSIVFAAEDALAADPPSTSKSSGVVKVAKGPKGKGAGASKDKGKPEKPEGAKTDPRGSGAAPVEAPAAAAPVGPAGETRRGMSRIEFDDRLIQGQTNKANAIYLFERRESSLRSLLKKRTDFHEEIDETLE